MGCTQNATSKDDMAEAESDTYIVVAKRTPPLMHTQGVFPMDNGQGPFFSGLTLQELLQYAPQVEYDIYYHHTDISSAMKILKSRQILQSEAKHGDAIVGNGTYLTKLGPSSEKHEVAKNNFDGLGKLWESKVLDGKTDIVFEIKLPKDKVQDYTNELKRDVHLHPGNINLLEVKYLKVHVRMDDKNFETVEVLTE